MHIDLTALFTKLPASRFPAVPWFAWVLFHHFTIPTVKPSMGERPLGVVPAAGIFGNGRLTKEQAALWIALLIEIDASKCPFQTFVIYNWLTVVVIQMTVSPCIEVNLGDGTVYYFGSQADCEAQFTGPVTSLQPLGSPSARVLSHVQNSRHTHCCSER